MSSIAAIILTFNEELHIERCIASLKPVCSEIFVIDSFSTDRTVELALKAGATQVLTNPWKNYSTQFNWALENAPITAEWLWRIDADEYITKKLADEIVRLVDTEAEMLKRKGINGFYVRRRIDFMGRKLLHGGWYPQFHLKVWRRGYGDCEKKWMDEHIRITEGTTMTIDIKEADQVDANLNDLTWWFDKHNRYATREMVDMLMLEYGMDDDARVIRPTPFGSQPERKRWLKMRYVCAPLFLRPLINFLIRYVLKLGFLDGKEGLIWHFLQGFCYRFLVDAKIFETKQRFGWRGPKIQAWIRENYPV